MIKLLAISGSLRHASINTMLLHAARRLAPEGVELTIYKSLGDLPLFNPDLEGNEPPSVRDLWRQVDAADGLLIASPEYAHGITGAMKNCLDWLVGGHEFVNKPVAVLNAAPRAHHAFDATKEIVRTMNGDLIEEACVVIPVSGLLAGRVIDETAIAGHPELAAALRMSLQRFARSLNPSP